MNETNKQYNYVPNQVNIRIRIRIRDIRFASYPTTSESVSELKYGKKCYLNPISCVSDPITSLTTPNWKLDRAPATYDHDESGH